MPAADFFRGATLNEVGRLHFMNWPVDKDEESDRNPLQLLNATPQDFVVVKLDIDTPDVETELVQQLLEDVKLHALVGVFYFEHHVRIHNFEWLWGPPFNGLSGTLVDSYAFYYFCSA